MSSNFHYFRDCFKKTFKNIGLHINFVPYFIFLDHCADATTDYAILVIYIKRYFIGNNFNFLILIFLKS